MRSDKTDVHFTLYLISHIDFSVAVHFRHNSCKPKYVTRCKRDT